MSATRIATVMVLPGVAPMPVVLRRPGHEGPLIVIDDSEDQRAAVEVMLGFPPPEPAS